MMLCVQCFEELELDERLELFYCDRVRCPNYHLYQIGEETDEKKVYMKKRVKPKS